MSRDVYGYTLMRHVTWGFPYDVITLSVDVYGYIAVYSCDVGSIFIEGGHTRTSVCTEGHWIPASVPGCHGNHTVYIV